MSAGEHFEVEHAGEQSVPGVVPVLQEAGPEWMDKEELGRIGLGRSNLRYAIKRGEIRVAWHRGRFLYRREDVESYMRRRGIAPLPPAPPGDRWVPVVELLRAGIPYHKVREAIERGKVRSARTSHRRRYVLASEARERLGWRG
ncbi:hypothetical protein MN1_290 [Thermus phage MN1]|nr:hypothetical protein MN1_290 [Thermus phage MN1]